MKKFTKIGLIIAAVMFGAGILFCGIASMMGAGYSAMRHMARNGGFDAGNWHISDQGIYYRDDDADWEEYDTWDDIEEETTVENSRYQTYAHSSVRNIELDVDAAEIYVKTATDADMIGVSLEYGREQYYECELDGDTLLVRYVRNHHEELEGNYAARLVIAVPEGTSFETVDLNIGAAKMIFEDLVFSCENLNVNVGAGRLEAENFKVTGQSKIDIGAGEVVMDDCSFQDIAIDCAMGNVEMDGVLKGSLNGNCAMGNMSIDLAGNREDYNYNLSCNMGSLEVNGKQYSGLGGEYNETNSDAVGTITLECDMGNVELDIE